MKKDQKIGVYTATAIVIANMIGTGVFTSIGFQIVNIQSIFALIMLWVIGGVIALTGALSYAELGAALPRSGGEYHLISSAYHPAVGFVAGWISVTVGFSAPTALAAMAMGVYFTSVFPLINPIVFAIIVIILLAAVHSTNIKTSSYFQIILTSLKVLLIILFIIAGLTVDNPQPVSFLPQSGSFSDLISPAFAISLIYVLYAYSGWNASVYITNEIEKPRRNIPRSVFLGTLGVMILYVLLNYVFLYTTPINELSGQVEVGFIAAQHIFGELGGEIMGIIISFLLVSMLSAMIWIGSRVSLVMGEDTKLLRFLAKKTKSGVPLYALWLQVVITICLLISASFEQILIYIGFTLSLSSFITVGGVFILRFKKPDLPRPYKTFGYPFTPIIYMGLSLWTMIYLLIDKPVESISGLLTMLSGLVFYFIDKLVYRKKKNQDS